MSSLKQFNVSERPPFLKLLDYSAIHTTGVNLPPTYCLGDFGDDPVTTRLVLR